MRQQTAWMQHLQQTYKNGKQQNAEYKYSQAMKDAKKDYKKQQGGNQQQQQGGNQQQQQKEE